MVHGAYSISTTRSSTSSEVILRTGTVYTFHGPGTSTKVN